MKLQSRITESQITSTMEKDYAYLTAQYNDCVASNKEAKRIEAAAARLSKDQKVYYPAKSNVPREVIIHSWCTPQTKRLIEDGKIYEAKKLLPYSNALLDVQRKAGVNESQAYRALAFKGLIPIKCKLWEMAGYVCNDRNTLMESNETKHLRLTPSQRRRMLMNIDVPTLLQDMPRHISRRDFISFNFDTYRLCIESWICLLREGISPSTQPGNNRLSLDEARINFYLELILRKGLITTILDAQVASDALIVELNGGEFLLPITNPFYEDVQLWRAKGEDPASILQILRYPKRLSIYGTTAAAYNAAVEFKEINQEHQRLEKANWSKYQWHYVLKVRKVLEKMFEGAYQKTLGLEGLIEVAKEAGYFSAGVVTGTSHNCAAAKAVQAELEGAILGSDAVYGSTFTDNVSKRHNNSYNYSSTSYSQSYLDPNRRKTRISEFHTVPKTAWSVRGVCYEQAGRQFLQQGFRKLLGDVVDTFGCIDLKDQSRNRDACILGSKYRNTVTVDLSHASDTISWKHVYDCYPNWIVDVFYQLRAPKIRMDKEEFRNSIAWTSGASLCFDCETYLFLAVAIAAIMEEREAQGKRSWPTQTELARCFQYGDDGVYPTEYASNIVRVLSILGFTVNTSKSYCSKTDAYRESCGEEAYDGKLLSGDYFPRKPMDLESDERLLSLISLQHRFFNSPTMGLFFIKAVEAVKSNAITCLPYVDDSTPWFPYDLPKVYYKRSTQSLCIKTMRFETTYTSVSSKELDRVGEILGYGQFLKHGTHIDYEGGIKIVKPLNHRALSGSPAISCSIKTIPFVIEKYPITFTCDDKVIHLSSDTELQEFCKSKLNEPANTAQTTQSRKQNKTSQSSQKKTEHNNDRKKIIEDKKSNSPRTK